jgi:hypothetical protein
MDPDEASVPRSAVAPGDRLERLSASARGWHTIQMAVLGFIGICGILRTTSSTAPRAVQLLAAALAVAALAVACMAIFTVGRVAYPVGDALEADRAVAGGTARLRAGIQLTIIALILAVIAALSGWWPSPASNPAVASPAPPVKLGAARLSAGQPMPSASVLPVAPSPCPRRSSPKSARLGGARRRGLGPGLPGAWTFTLRREPSGLGGQGRGRNGRSLRWSRCQTAVAPAAGRRRQHGQPR